MATKEQMVRKVVFTDSTETYWSDNIRDNKTLANAIAKTYTKSWALIASVDGSPYVVGSTTVNYKLLPYPEVRFRNFTITRVNVTVKGSNVYIEFT